jgi:paraquat-inducible protein B
VKTKVSPAVIGAFVIGALALMIVALLSFGGVNFFSKPQRFVVYFDESIHGLDLGSPVKLRGVRVGRVVALNIRYDDKSNRSVVAVVCEFSRDVMTDGKGEVINVTDRDELQLLVERGLRAQLGVLGLATGMLFVQLDFFNPKDFPANGHEPDPRYIAVPAVTSTISEFQASVSEILQSVKKVNFPELAKELTALMIEARKRIEGVDVRATVEQWRRTGAQVEALAGSAEVRQALININAASVELRGVLLKIDALVAPTSKDLTETLAQARVALGAFNDAATAARKFVSAQSGLGDEFVATLQQLNEAADAVKRLADFLERNPSALLTGKKRPE